MAWCSPTPSRWRWPPHGRQAGSASALLGAFQSAMAAVMGALVGLLHDGTALPMVGVIAASVTAAFLIMQWVTRREGFRVSSI